MNKTELVAAVAHIPIPHITARYTNPSPNIAEIQFDEIYITPNISAVAIAGCVPRKNCGRKRSI